jgi:lysophospholipase L1-like esterase
MAGTNDVSSKKSILEILVSFRRLIQCIRAVNPSCKIAICGLLRRPCDEFSKTKQTKLEDFNEALKADCELTNVYYITTSKALKDMGPDTLLYRHDGIHLTFDGVGCLKGYMEGIIGSIMGMPPQWDPIQNCIIPK